MLIEVVVARISLLSAQVCSECNSVYAFHVLFDVCNCDFFCVLMCMVYSCWIQFVSFV